LSASKFASQGGFPGKKRFLAHLLQVIDKTHVLPMQPLNRQPFDGLLVERNEEFLIVCIDLYDNSATSQGFLHVVTMLANLDPTTAVDRMDVAIPKVLLIFVQMSAKN
jgi:hypothetical protein